MSRTTRIGSFVAAALATTLAATLAATPGAGPAAAAAPDHGLAGGPDRVALQRLLDAEHAAGMPGAFAVVRDGRRTVRLTSGVADVHTGRRPSAGMRHRIGSVTKTFVATTVLQLAGERRIDLDAPVGRYLPTLVPGQTGRDVTVRMLLNHTSGIGDYDTAIIRTLDDIVTMGQTTWTPQRLVALGLAEPPTNAPGAASSYSNTNYIVLGELIRQVTGRSYGTEVSRRILRPLGLRDTYFEGAEPRIRGPHMSAYVPWPPDGALRDFTVYNMTWGGAAGEMVSTADDLNTFYRALLGGRLLAPDLLRQMQDTIDDYGLGLYRVDLPCGRVWGHDGGTIGHLTISWHTADGRRQVTLAENMSFYRTTEEPHPIDVARIEFLLAAFCGPQPAAAARSATTIPYSHELHRL